MWYSLGFALALFCALYELTIAIRIILRYKLRRTLILQEFLALVLKTVLGWGYIGYLVGQSMPNNPVKWLQEIEDGFTSGGCD